MFSGARLRAYPRGVGDTLSNETRDPIARPRSLAHLFRVLCATRRDDPPARHVLVDLDEVELGRGDRAGHARDGGRLRLEVADAWASQRHARLIRPLGRWEIEDLGSKNHTLVNGAPVTRAVLTDGDIVEIGRSHFAFAAALDWTPGTARDQGLEEPLPGVETIVPSLAQALARLAVIARGGSAVVIRGPTGAGKEVAARAIHAASGRAGTFVPVNCGAIPRDLVESTLFGHRRGAFSGAVDDEVGLIRAADRGTLFLDEIGDLPLPAQAALLRVLQEQEVTAVGTSRPIAIDLRVVCATHRDLDAMAAAGTFRADLLHRLGGFTVTLPALAERRVDLGILIARLCERHAPGRAIALHPRAARALLAHAWPGNVRELDRVLGAALDLAVDGTIAVEHLPPTVGAALDHPVVPASMDDQPQRERLIAVLGEQRGNIRAVARSLGKDPAQIRRWLRRYGLDAAAFRT
jgi:transcriptional regulator of acetoin/glycerol metabolism